MRASSNLTGKVAAIQRKYELRRCDARERHAVVERLPAWPEAVRGAPNATLRSALFGAIRRGPRRYLQRVAVCSVQGLEIVYSGPRLDQADLDVWMECLHLAGQQNAVGHLIDFSAKAFLRALGRAAGKSDREWLLTSLTRLSTTTVEISDAKRLYWGSMLDEGYKDKDTGRYVIEVNPQIAVFFDRDGWTAVDSAHRRALKGLALAQWLYAFYQTHADPYSYKVATLQALCGSETKDLSRFRQMLRAALAHVARLTGWAWQIDADDLVHVNKAPVSAVIAPPPKT